MKKVLSALATCAAMMFAGSVAATPINVGGVVWDPDAGTAFPSEIDFSSHGSVFENAVNPLLGIFTVNGRGKIERMNSTVGNETAFCPGCELTYTFSMDLVSITDLDGAGPGTAQGFVFNNLQVSMWVDSTPDYDGSAANAHNAGDLLWLSLTGNSNLTGFGVDIGTGSDQGSGSARLDVTGGVAAANFNTNTKFNGADFVFTSSFQPANFDENGVPMLTGTVDLVGNSIPEPSSLALLGLALIGGAAATRRRK